MLAILKKQVHNSYPSGFARPKISKAIQSGGFFALEVPCRRMIAGAKSSGITSRTDAMNVTERTIHNLATELASTKPRHYLSVKASLEGLVRIAIQNIQADMERDFQQAMSATREKK